MATNNSNNNQFTNNADGFDLSGGTTKRKVTITGADVTLTGSGSNTYTMPAASDTLLGTKDFTGIVLPYAGTSAPTNWLLCYGQAISRTTYAALFSTISTTYGVGDGSTTFNIPDIRGRVIAGLDNMGGTSANRLTNPGSTGGMDGDILGNTGGQEAHVQTSGELAAHTHNGPATSDGNMVGGGSGGSAAGISLGGAGYRVYISPTTGSTGSSTAANVIQPTIILNYIIHI